MSQTTVITSDKSVRVTSKPASFIVDDSVIVSGIKPTGRPHLGNYFGAVRQHIKLSAHKNTFFFIANYHAMTTLQDTMKLREYSDGIALDYLALGLNPERAALYLQSDVPEVTELSWVLANLTTVPELERGVSYKDAAANHKPLGAGLLTYPVLMAADILIHRATHVPVGRDQQQHLEVARQLARRFNRLYQPVFSEPEGYILEDVAVIPGTDGRKMSKSYGNTIGVFDEGKQLKQRVMRIVTDNTPLEFPKNPDDDNVFALIRLFASAEQQAEVAAAYRAGGYGYAEAKRLLIALMDEAFMQARERRYELMNDMDYVRDVLHEGAKKARASAQDVMNRVREATGLITTY